MLALVESEKNLVIADGSMKDFEKRIINADLCNFPFFNNRMHIKLLRENERLIGLITYNQIVWIVRTIGVLVIDKDFRGKGYARQLLEYAARDNGKEKAKVIMGFALSNNVDAIAVYKKLGAQEMPQSKIGNALQKLINCYRSLCGKPSLPKLTEFVYYMDNLPPLSAATSNNL